MADTNTTATAARRTRGQAAGLNLSRILDAAGEISPATLTVQAVADRLGVDRKAVRHYVKDHQTLLSLLAWHTFSAQLRLVPTAPDRSWQEACRTYAQAVAHAAVAIGPLASHLRLGEPLLVSFVTRTEQLLGALTDAGFSDEDALRSVVLLTHTSLSYARDTAARSDDGSRRSDVVRDVLEQQEPDSFPHLRRVLATGIDTYDSRQLDLSIDVIVRGIEDMTRHDTVNNEND